MHRARVHSIDSYERSPAPVSESATPIEPPRGPQIQPTTTFNAQFNSNPSAYPITTPREYIVLNSEFDVIPLICHLTNKVTSGSILCFVESINTLEPLGSLVSIGYLKAWTIINVRLRLDPLFRDPYI